MQTWQRLARKAALLEKRFWARQQWIWNHPALATPGIWMTKDKRVQNIRRQALRYRLLAVIAANAAGVDPLVWREFYNPIAYGRPAPLRPETVKKIAGGVAKMLGLKETAR